MLANATIQGGVLPPAWASPNFPLLESLTLAAAPGSAPLGSAGSWAALPTNLAALHLEGLTLTPALPTVWGSHMRLAALTLRNLAFTSATSFSDSWANIRLVNLTLDGVVNMTGPLPATWAAGTASLSRLTVSSMPGLTASLADYVALLVGASKTAPAFELAITGMSFAGQLVPATLCGAAKAQKVVLPGLGLTGALGSCWQHSPALKLLDLSGNALGGSLPDAWLDAGWQGVSVNVSNCGLSGVLPPAWGTASNVTGATMKLALLDVSHNSISGGQRGRPAVCLLCSSHAVSLATG